MNKVWKRIIAVMCGTMAIAASAVQAAAGSFGDIPLDRVFDENRTLYYVEVTDGNVYDLNVDGYSQVKKADSAAQTGIYSSKNVSVLKNDSTGREYRFVFTKSQNSSGVQITGAQVSSDGKLSVSGILKTDKKLNVIITMPKEAFSDEAYDYGEIDKSNMEQYVICTAEVSGTEQNSEQSLLEYQFPDDAPCGTYKVMIIGDETDASYDIYYLSQAEIDSTVKEFNELTKKEADNTGIKAVREFIQKNYKALYLELEYYKRLSDTAKDTVARLMMSREGEYAHSDIKPEFIGSIAVAWSNDGKAIGDMVNAYPSDIEFAMYEKYGALKSKSLVDNSIKSAENYTDLTNRFNSMTALSLLNEAAPNEVGGILKDYKQYLISDKAYEYYCRNESVCLRNITNKNFDTTEKLEKAILSAKETTDAPKPDGRGVSGGSNKSNNTITAPSTPTVIIPQNDKPANSRLPFTDLENYKWAYTAIEHLYNNNICAGKDETTFAPQDNILREEAVKLIINAFAIEQSADVKINFADVPENAWYAEFVKAAVGSKIAEGISETEFGTGSNITRQDLAVMLYRALKTSGKEIDIIIDNKAVLNDLDEVSEYAVEAVDYFIEIGAITGSDGKFRPKDYITRAEAAQMIYSVIKIR